MGALGLAPTRPVKKLTAPTGDYYGPSTQQYQRAGNPVQLANRGADPVKPGQPAPQMMPGGLGIGPSPYATPVASNQPATAAGNDNIRSNLEQMQAQNAAIAQRNASGGLQPYQPQNVGPSGLFSTGGAYGQPGPSSYAAGGPGSPIFQGIAQDKRNNASQPLNVAIGQGMLQGRGNPAVVQPEHDFGYKPSGLFGTDENGHTIRKNGYSTLQLQAQADAKKKFDDRRGGLAARQEAYQARQGAEQKERSAGVLGQAGARSEARRARMGEFSPDELLAQQNPMAAAQRKLGEGQLGLAKSNTEAQNAYRRDQLAAQERMNTENNKTKKDVVSIGLAKEAGLDPDTKLPIGTPAAPPLAAAPALPPRVTNSVRQRAASGDIEGAREEMAANGITSKDQQNKALDEATGKPNSGLGFWEQPVQGTGVPGRRPMNRGEALGAIGRRVKGWLFGPGSQAKKP